jgi:hypothetical protein
MTKNKRDAPSRRLTGVTTVVIALVLVAGCADAPTESVTASLTEGGTRLQIVVKSDSTAIAAIEANESYSNDPNFAPVSFSAGDTHTGPHVCGFTVSNSSHTYQVDYYGTVTAGAAAVVCSAAAQTHFLATAP